MSAAGKTILIAEDEVDLRTILSEMLEEEGFECIQVGDGKEALKILETRPVDVVVSDYNMPGLDGLELLRCVHERGITTPVIWLSGRANPDQFRDAWSAGVFDFFQKPVDFSRFKSTIESALMADPQGHSANRTRLLKGRKLTELHIVLDNEIAEDAIRTCTDSGISVTTYVAQILSKNFKKSKAA
jgi:DNA-binding NtrC family response regulator